MEILFLADNFPPEKNAQASRVYERACYWTRWGHTVTVITGAPNFPEGKLYPGYENRWRQVEQMDGIRVVRVKTYMAANAGRLLRILDFLSYMLRALLFGLFERKPDVLVATSPQFFAALAGWALSVIHNVPFVLELSDLWPDSVVAVGAMRRNLLVRMAEKVELFLYGRSAAIVALTQAFKHNLVRREVPPDKVHVVLNGVDLSRFQPCPKDPALASEIGIEPDEFVISYIGTHGMAHGLMNVLDAAELLVDTKVRFLFVGPGAERQRLIDEARRRGLPNVTFVPAQPKNRMAAFWSLSDVALVHLKDTPVFQAVIPSKIFEAMGMGLPVLLATPDGEARTIIESEGVGVWIAPGDPVALAGECRLLASSPELVRRLAAKSLRAAPNYSRERQARSMIEVLQGLTTPTLEAKLAWPDRVADRHARPSDLPSEALR